MTTSAARRWVAMIVATASSSVAAAATAAASATTREPPVVESRCAAGGAVDASFRDAALGALRALAVDAPGREADGALRSQSTPGHVEPGGTAWHPVHAYAGNLAMLGALRLDRSMLPTAERWLRWQVRTMPVDGPQRGIVPDRWLRADLTQSACPPGREAQRCAAVDADDSTAASTLLLADAYVRHGGRAALLREPDVRRALEAAAQALRALAVDAGGGSLTLASRAHPVLYTMDQAEVVAGRRAWARVLEAVYGQPASAAVERAQADAAVAAMGARLGRGAGWAVSADAAAPDFRRWYPDTVAQAWPLLWGADGDGRRGVPAWRRAASAWPRSGGAASWAAAPPDPDGFRWASAAVAARCSGDDASARAWVAAARVAWLDSPRPFGWPFHVGEVLWLSWLADPVAPESLPSPAVLPVDRKEQP